MSAPGPRPSRSACCRFVSMRVLVGVHTSTHYSKHPTSALHHDLFPRSCTTTTSNTHTMRARLPASMALYEEVLMQSAGQKVGRRVARVMTETAAPCPVVVPF